MTHSWKADAQSEGLRLDKALSEVLPKLGLRARRRLLAGGHVRLNGKIAKGAMRLRQGDVVEWDEPEEKEPEHRAFFLGLEGEFCFFFKPSGLHSCHIAASSEPSLESCLPRLLPASIPSGTVRLLQRLDRATSGIVAAAITGEAERNYRFWEKAGKIRKYYLAALIGRLTEDKMADAALDTDNRRKTRILCHPGDKATFFHPLKVWDKVEDSPFQGREREGGPVSLTGCLISAGQRHQIRAHASWLGYPLCGDGLYGTGKGAFLLCHCALSFPGHYTKLDASLMPDFPSSTRQLVNAWLEDAEKA